MPEVKVKKPDAGPMPWYKQLWTIRDTIIIVATPLLLLPIIIVYPTSKPAKCAYTIGIMSIYWMTECLPMSVTALIPIVLFPWLGVLGSKTVCTNYLKDANMLFFGGLLVAVAVEKWNLHKRVALRVLLLVGSKPLWIIFGFMAVTDFLSMWLNNTATTAMMMPIAHAVLTELDANRKRQLQLKEIAIDAPGKGTEVTPLQDDGGAKPDDVVVEDGVANGSPSTGSGIKATETDKDRNKIGCATETEPLQAKDFDGEVARSDRMFMNFRKALKLSIPYASSIGGTGTLIGCGPNIVLKGQLESMYKDAETGINFTSWLVIGFPAMVFDLIVSWLILMIMFFGPKETLKGFKRGTGDQDDSANQVIRTEYEKLGKITFAEVTVLVNFIVLALLWLSREPEFIPGWGSMMSEKGFVTDASVAISISVLLFILPSQLPNYLCFRKQDADKPPGPAAPILDWPTVNKQMPWSVIILLGGGFALADACKESGLSAAIGESLYSFRYMPPAAIVALMCILATIVTNFTSNMATTTIFIPILAEVSASTCVNPIYLMLPVTLAASWSYLLPVSTPPNAIAYSYGDIAISDMIKAGLVLCVLCNAVLLFSINTWGYTFFNLGTFPAWAVTPGSNCTATGVTAVAGNVSVMLTTASFDI